MNRIAVLLSTYNGQRFLAGQLDSLRAQTHEDWVLYWRDDGSSDAIDRVFEPLGRNLPALIGEALAAQARRANRAACRS